MEVDYRKVMGAEVEALCAASNSGRGVSIAILDSGTPSRYLHGGENGLGAEQIDEFGHATAISSMLFGDAGIFGVCEEAEPVFYPVLDASGHGNADSVADGIYRAIDDDVDLINLSLGFERTEKCPKRLEIACEDAFEAGKTIFCAAGNDGGPVNWPAALETTICVGSAGYNGLKTPFSSVGEVDFVAPGLNLSVSDGLGGLKTVSGTSFSTALVTGVAALLIPSIRAENSGWADATLVRKALCKISRDVGEPGKDYATGFGLIGKDPTVCMRDGRTKFGFFGTILEKIHSLLGFKAKEKTNGRV